jgi:hypothetical protein
MVQNYGAILISTCMKFECQEVVLANIHIMSTKYKRLDIFLFYINP